MSYAIWSIEGNSQRLDGGAMFGNVPRALWEKWVPPDERHRIPLGCRAFLIHDRTRERRILLEAGIGVFFEPRFQDRYGVVEPDHRLLANLARVGVSPADIDVVVLSHLHFDHAGGLLNAWRAEGSYELVFPRARFVVGQRAWERARAPHLRDRVSFFGPLCELLARAESEGRLDLVREEGPTSLGQGFHFYLSDGHTPGMLLLELSTARGAVQFCGDLIPGRPWIHLPVTMGYDRFPELLIDEKQRLLERCQARGTTLLLTHDPTCAACGVRQDEGGRFRPTEERETLQGLEL